MTEIAPRSSRDAFDGMEVADGQAAGLAWESLISGICGLASRKQKRKALLDYYGQDTLGMVRLVLRQNSSRP